MKGQLEKEVIEFGPGTYLITESLKKNHRIYRNFNYSSLGQQDTVLIKYF